jgi:hypothetical protein
LVLEIARAARLLALEGDSAPVTTAYDDWADRSPAARLTKLLLAWWRLGLTPSQSRDDEGKALPALAFGAGCEGCLAARRGLLLAAASLPAGTGAVDTAAIGAAIRWHLPMADELPQDTSPFASVLREAERLGVIARGALSPLGAALLAEDHERLAAEAERLLPSSTEAARFGADLTAVVAGTPTARLAALLDSVADREATGAASVWRFAPATIRRALDAGRTAKDIEAALTSYATGPLPQPLTYLIADVARRHGGIRVASAAVVIHGEDSALLAEIAANRRLAKLGLRLIAPTVLLSRSAMTETLAALRAEGYAPVAEAPNGRVKLEKTTWRRAEVTVPQQRRGQGMSGAGKRSVDVSALATRLAAGADLRTADALGLSHGSVETRTEREIAGHAKYLSHADIRLLAFAVEHDREVTIEYVAESGSRTVRTISGLELAGSLLTAWCHLREAERVFALSRIRTVMPRQ